MRGDTHARVGIVTGVVVGAALLTAYSSLPPEYTMELNIGGREVVRTFELFKPFIAPAINSTGIIHKVATNAVLLLNLLTAFLMTVFWGFLGGLFPDLDCSKGAGSRASNPFASKTVRKLFIVLICCALGAGFLCTISLLADPEVRSTVFSTGANSVAELVKWFINYTNPLFIPAVLIFVLIVVYFRKLPHRYPPTHAALNLYCLLLTLSLYIMTNIYGAIGFFCGYYTHLLIDTGTALPLHSFSTPKRVVRIPIISNWFKRQYFIRNDAVADTLMMGIVALGGAWILYKNMM